MQYRSSANETTAKDVGVTADLVPVYTMETTTRAFSAKVEAFLHHSLAEYAEKGELYSLFDWRSSDLTETGVFNKGRCDTGIIENNIMKHLPEDTKRTFRVAKYLISQYFDSATIAFDGIKSLDKETRLRLYGIKPCIPSYTLRAVFLHLLLHVHGTDAEQRLKGGLYLLCLFDILKQCSEKSEEIPNILLVRPYHPLLGESDVNHVIYLMLTSEHMTIIKRLIEKEHAADMVDQFSLLNSNRPDCFCQGSDDGGSQS